MCDTNLLLRTIFVVTCSSILGGCIGEGSNQLATLSGLQILLDSDQDSLPPGTIRQDRPANQLVLLYENKDGSSTCLPLTGHASAFVNGDPAVLVSLGGGPATDDDGPVASCRYPRWSFTPRPVDEAETSFEINDGDRRIGVTLQALGAPRQTTLQTPASGQIVAGGLLALHWLPETDVVETLPAPDVVVSFPNISSGRTNVPVVAYGAGQLFVYAPTSLATGPQQLFVSGFFTVGWEQASFSQLDVEGKNVMQAELPPTNVTVLPP